MSLSAAIDEFDGKLIEPLKLAAAEFDDADAVLLVELCHSDQAVAATWVVKALLETGRGSALDLVWYFSALGRDQEWLATLHVLQSVQFAPDMAMGEVFEIRGLLKNPKTFVRVWALDAFVRIALVDQGFLAEAQALVAAAAKSDAGSMRSRARALQKLLA